jgi:hypothetical protein
MNDKAPDMEPHAPTITELSTTEEDGQALLDPTMTPLPEEPLDLLDPTMPSETQSEPTSSSSPLLYISPVLQAIDPELRPTPSPACETCPASVWFTTTQELKCFCPRMHIIAWEKKEPPIRLCDGREMAILEWLAAKGLKPTPLT